MSLPQQLSWYGRVLETELVSQLFIEPDVRRADLLAQLLALLPGALARRRGERLAVRNPQVAAPGRDPRLHAVHVGRPEHDAGHDRHAGANRDRAHALLDPPAAKRRVPPHRSPAFRADADD